MICPHDHQKVLDEYYIAGEKELLAVETAETARIKWENSLGSARAIIFLFAPARQIAVLLNT